MTRATLSPLPVMRGPVFCGAQRLNAGPGERCRRPAGAGTDHPRYGRCSRHGGNTPTQVQAAHYAIAQDSAALYGVPRDVDPIDGLMEEYARTMGVVEALEAMVAQLSPSEIWWGVQSVEESTTGAGGDGEDGESLTPPERKTRSGAALNLQVRLFNEERDRGVRIAETILKLDLENRRVAIGQSHVAALVQILLSPELGLSEEQRRVAARQLRALDASQATIEGSVA